MNVKIRVLIAEDDDNDAALLRRAISKIDPLATFYIAHDGMEAMHYFKADGKFTDRSMYPFPRVLITDLKMPRLNGFELLEWLQAHPECNVIPKIVFSASSIPEDVVKAYQLGANAFFQKPSSFDQLIALIELNFRLWASAELPPDTIAKCA